MPLVVLLRGINVGGHRRFRPTTVAERLEHLGVVNFGAAGTFVVRRPVTRTRLREEFARLLPFDAEVVICEAKDILRLTSSAPFANQPVRPDVVRFVSVLARRPHSSPATPFRLPASGRWLLNILGRDDRLVVGVYRREMKVIGYLGAIDRLYGVPATTRSWSTLATIADTLRNPTL